MNPRTGLDISEKRKVLCHHRDSDPGPSNPLHFLDIQLHIFTCQITYVSFLSLLTRFPNYQSHAHPLILHVIAVRAVDIECDYPVARAQRI